MKKKTNGQPIGEPFFPVVLSLFESDKYRALPSFARDVLQLMMYLRNKNQRGDFVSLGARGAANWWNADHMTAWRALRRLKKDGFITEIHKGHLVPQAGRQNISTTWRINVAPFTPVNSERGENDRNPSRPSRNNVHGNPKIAPRPN